MRSPREDRRGSGHHLAHSTGVHHLVYHARPPGTPGRRHSRCVRL